MVDALSKARHASLARVLADLLAVLLPVCVGLLLWQVSAAGSLETTIRSGMFDLRGERAAPKTVAVVAIDRQTWSFLSSRFGISAYEARDRVPRRFLAKALNRLRAAGAGPVAIDLILDQRTTSADDRALSRALAAYRKTVLAYQSPSGSSFMWPWLGGGIESLGKVRSEPGHVQPSGDASRNPKVIGMPMLVDGIEPLGVAAARLRQPNLDIPDTTPGTSLVGVSDDAYMINFYGPPGTLRRVNLAELLGTDRESLRAVTGLSGRLIVVGYDDPLADPPRPTSAPGGGSMTGAEIHATVAANALDGGFLRPAPPIIELLLIVVAGSVCPAAMVAGGRALVVSVLGGCLAAALAAAVFLLFSSGLVVPVVPIAAAFAASIASWLLFGLARTERDRQALRRRFAAFDEELVDELLGGTEVGGALTADLVVPGYRLESVVGRGAMGVVYQATEIETTRQAAVKVLRPELADDDHFRSRFEREARLSTRLEHPNVLPVYAAGEEDGILFIACRLVEGRDLGQVLQEDGVLSSSEVLEVVEAVASALDRAHAINLIHRDVKPANVLVDEAGPGRHIYLSDFGIASDLEGRTLTVAGVALGTMGYAAPEQLAGQPVNASADVYGLGALAFALLTGEPPLPVSLTPSELRERLNNWPPTVEGLPELDAFFAGTLDQDPGRRFPSAGAAARCLAEAVSPESSAR